MGIFKPFVLAIASLPFVSSGFVTPILQNHLSHTKSLCFPNEVNVKVKSLDMGRSNGDKADWKSEFEKIIFGRPSCRNPEFSRSPISSSTIDAFIGTLCLAGIGIPWVANAAGNDGIHYLLPSTTNTFVGCELAAIMTLLAFPGLVVNKNEPQLVFAMDNFNYGNQFPGGRTPSPQPSFPIRPPAPPQQPNRFSASNSPMPKKSYLKKAKSAIRKVKKIKPMANPAAYLNNAPAPSPSWLSNPFNPSPPDNNFAERSWDTSSPYEDYGVETEEKEQSFPQSILDGVSSFFNNFRISMPGSSPKDSEMNDNYNPNFTPMQQTSPIGPARIKKTKVLGPAPGSFASPTNNMGYGSNTMQTNNMGYGYNVPSQTYSQDSRSKGSPVTFAPPDLKSKIVPVTAQKRLNSPQYNYYDNSQDFSGNQATTYKDNYGYSSTQNSFGNNASPNFSPKKMLPGVNYASPSPAYGYKSATPAYSPAQSYYDQQSYNEQQPYYDQQSYTQGQPSRNLLSFSTTDVNRDDKPPPRYQISRAQPYQQSYYNEADQAPPQQSFFQRFRSQPNQQPNQQSYYNEVNEDPGRNPFSSATNDVRRKNTSKQSSVNYADRSSSPYSSGSMDSTRNFQSSSYPGQPYGAQSMQDQSMYNRNNPVSFAAPDVNKGPQNSGRPQSGYPPRKQFNTMQNIPGDYQTNDESSSSGLFNNIFNKGNRSLKKTKVANDRSMGRKTYQPQGAPFPQSSNRFTTSQNQQPYNMNTSQQGARSFTLGSDDVTRSNRPPVQSNSNQFMNAGGPQGTFSNDNKFNSPMSPGSNRSNLQGPSGTNQNEQSSSPGLFNMFNRGNEQAASPTQSSSSLPYATGSNQQSYGMNNARSESGSFSLSSDNVVRTNRPIAAKSQPQSFKSFTGSNTPNNQFPPTSKKSTIQKQSGNGMFNNMFNKGSQPLKKTKVVRDQSMGNRFNTPVTSPPPFQRSTNAPNQQSFQNAANSGSNSFSLGSDDVNRFNNPGSASFSSSNQYTSQPNQPSYNFKKVKSGSNQFSASPNGTNRFTTPVAPPNPFSQRSTTSQNQQPYNMNTAKQGSSSFTLGSDNVTRSNRPPVQSNSYRSMNAGGPQGTLNTGNRSPNIQGPSGTNQNKQSSSPGLFSMFNRGNQPAASPTQSSSSQQYSTGSNQQSYGMNNARPGSSSFSLSSDNVSPMNRPIGQTPQISPQGTVPRNANIGGKSSSTFFPGSMGSTQNGPSFNSRGIMGNKKTSSKNTASGMTYYSPASSEGTRLTPPVSAPAQRFGTGNQFMSNQQRFTSGPQSTNNFTGSNTPNNQFSPTSKKSTMQKQPGNGMFNNMFNKGSQPLAKTNGVGNQSMGNRFNTPVTSPPPFQRSTNAPNQQSFQNTPNLAANGVQNKSASGGLFNMFNRGNNAPLKKTKLAGNKSINSGSYLSSGSPGQYAPTTKKSYMQKAKMGGNAFSLGSDDVERFNRPMPSSRSTSQNSWQ